MNGDVPLRNGNVTYSVNQPLSPHALKRISCLMTTYFVVFAPDDSIADFVHLSALLCSDFIYIFNSNKNWKIITM
jgi:hypothetical protein